MERYLLLMCLIKEILRLMIVTNMQLFVMSYIKKEKRSNYLQAMSHHLGILSNGINNYLVRVREKKIKEFFQLELILQLTFIQWDNLYNREQGIYLKL